MTQNTNTSNDDHVKERVPAGQLKKGDIVIINGKACKIVEISTSKTGKH